VIPQGNIFQLEILIFRTGAVYILISNYLVGFVGAVMTFLGVFSVRRFGAGNILYKERTLVQSIALIQSILGFVAIATAGSGWGAAFAIGFFVIVAPALGFSGAFYMKRILLILVTIFFNLNFQIFNFKFFLT
jgi:hypothetical protein